MADSTSSTSAYGGKGPLLLGITWSEAALAVILVGLRAKTASFCPPGHAASGLFGLRWDFIWVMVALVKSPSLYPLRKYFHSEEHADDGLIVLGARRAKLH